MAKAPKSQTVNNLTLIPSDYQPVVISSLKRSFSRGPVVREFLRKNRREEDWVKKDGSKAKNKHVFYKCAQCHKEFNSTHIQVDHIEPVVPVNIPAKHMSIDTFIKRLYVQEDKLQILCKVDHKAKSKLENATRKEWSTKIKFIVYQTINRKNYKAYIGVHKCEDYDDGYIGSGTLLKTAIDKYGYDSFYRFVLFSYETAEEAYNKEQELVNEEWISSDETYNVVIGGIGNSKDAYSDRSKKIICHQTGIIYESVTNAALEIDVSASSISKVINNPNEHVKNLHFFTTDVYDPKIKVIFPINQTLRRIVYLNNKKIFSSIKEAADQLKLNYKSLRNVLLFKTVDNVHALDGHYFLYEYEYDPTIPLSIITRKLFSPSLNKTFNTATEAALFLKRKNLSHSAIAIAKGARNKGRMYGHTWQYIESELLL